MAKNKVSKLIPDDFGDFLSILSFLGFLAIILKFGFDNSALDSALTPLFLVIGGAGLMVVGKVFSIKKWARDGIQPNEYSQVFVITFGLVSVVLGSIMFAGINLSERIMGWIGFLAFAPAIFILIDYYKANISGRRSR